MIALASPTYQVSLPSNRSARISTQTMVTSSLPPAAIAVASATGIQILSAFVGEKERVIAPGTRLRVHSTSVARDRLCNVGLNELDAPRVVT